jgi:hypothetical protein
VTEIIDGVPKDIDVRRLAAQLVEQARAEESTWSARKGC